MELSEFYTHIAPVQGGHYLFCEIVILVHGTQQCGIELYDIDEYFRRLMVNQWTLDFWDVIAWYQSLGMRIPRASWVESNLVQCCILIAQFDIRK